MLAKPLLDLPRNLEVLILIPQILLCFIEYKQLSFILFYRGRN